MSKKIPTNRMGKLVSAPVYSSVRAVITASHLVLGLVMIMASPFTKAEVTTQNLTLQQAIVKVQDYQQTQGVWQAQLQITDANLKQSKLWSNPSLTVEQAGFKSDQEQDLAFGISQQLDVFGQRKAGYALAQLAQSQRELNQRIYSAQLDLVVKYLWSQLAIFELERDLVVEQLKVSRENLEALEKRYKAGSIAQVDVERVRITYEENVRLYHQADLQLQVATQQLSNLWGEADKTIKIGRTAQTLWPSTTAELVQQYLTENLVEKSRQLQVLEAKASIDYLKAKARPNPTVNLGVNNKRSPDASTENQVILGVSIPLNIFDRNQYGIKVAQTKQALLGRQQQFYLQQNALEIGTILTNLQGLSFQFKQVNDVQIPLAVNVQKKTLLGFTAGKFAVADVQQATMQLQEVRFRKVQLLKEAWQRAIEAESLSLGIEPSQVMAKDALSQINQTVWQQTQALPVIGGEN